MLPRAFSNDCLGNLSDINLFLLDLESIDLIFSVLTMFGGNLKCNETAWGSEASPTVEDAKPAKIPVNAQTSGSEKVKVYT
jgi:hypothetical protein